MIGRTLSHYRVVEKLGEGGMGVVYKAEDMLMRRAVALKFLSPKALPDETLRARFLREAQAAGALNHPNICTVYGVEEVEDTLFIVMMYVSGTSLDRLAAEKAFSVRQATDIAIQVGEGLREAHQHGIVHRDVKSANILVTGSGRAVVTDFGVAFLADRSRITRAGTTVGTLAYLSPEQALGKQVDRRTDIWSLGVVMYEMCTGELPFRGATAHAVCRAVLAENPRPAAAVRPGLPAEMGRILDKTLSKNTAERYQHIDDLLVDLRAVHRTLPEEDSPPHLVRPGSFSGDATVSTITVGVGGQLATEVGNGGRETRTARRWGIVLAALGAIIVVALVSIWWMSNRP